MQIVGRLPFFVEKALAFQQSNDFPRYRFRKTRYVVIGDARHIAKMRLASDFCKHSIEHQDVQS